MSSVEDLAIDVGLGVNTDDYEHFIDDVIDLLNDKQNNMIDRDQIASLCERSKLKIANDVLNKCYHRSRKRYQRTNQREHTFDGQRTKQRETSTKPKWWQTYHNDKIRKRSPEPLPKGRQLQEKRRRHERKLGHRLRQKESPVREMNLQFSPKTEDVPTWPGRRQSPQRRRRRSPSPPYRRRNKRRRR
tara:strand:+ start:2535 stop:3098 length:564 start_codon:yes stop_codon:yes gene_type:complete